MFSWTYDIFLKIVKILSVKVVQKKKKKKENVEETVLKSFVDMVECIFMDGK